MDIQPWIETWGHPAVFALVLAEFLGLPVPSALAVAAAAALPGAPFSSAGLVATACAAALIGDSVWYLVGRARGEGLLELYCRATLGSAACPRRTRDSFARFGAPSLVAAKFVPGLSTFAAPMAGLLRVPYPVFLAWDALGSALWAGTFVLAGRSVGTLVLQRWGDTARLWGGRAVGGLAAAAAPLGEARSYLAGAISSSAPRFLPMRWMKLPAAATKASSAVSTGEKCFLSRSIVSSPAATCLVVS